MECIEVVESLSQREKNAILSVLRRDEKLQQSQEKKIKDLRHDIQMIRTKGVLRAGDDQNKICLRCREPFGLLFNRGTVCPTCHVKVCKSCQSFLFNGTWMCVMCYKQRQLKWLTGEWALGDNPLRKWASGSDLIRASMKLRPISTTSIDIDDPPQPRSGSTGAAGKKPSQNGVHGPDSSSSKARVGYPKEGDQHRLSQLFDVLRTRKPDDSPVQTPQTEIKRVNSRRYSESDSDSSSSSYGDETSMRSSPNTAVSLTESELDARRLDSPPIGDASSPRNLGSPRSQGSPRSSGSPRSHGSPISPMATQRLVASATSLGADMGEREGQGQDKDKRGHRPKAAPRSPKPSPRKKRQNEVADPQKSPVNIQNEPVDPNRVVRPKVRPRSGDKGQRSPRKTTDVNEELADREGSSGGKDHLQVESDLSMHVSRTRESLDRKQEAHRSRTSLDQSPVKITAASPSEQTMRSLGEQSARKSSDNVSVRSSGSDHGRIPHRKSDDRLSGDRVSRSSKQDLALAEADLRTSVSRETFQQTHDIQIDVSDVQNSYPSQTDVTANIDHMTSDRLANTQTESKHDDMQAMNEDDTQIFLPAPRTGSPYSFSMDSLPSSHPSPTARRSIGGESTSLLESSDTDSLSRHSHTEAQEHSGTESAPKEGSEEDFVVEEISKIRFKTVSRKIAQASVLAKISKSPNKNDSPNEMRQRATQDGGSLGSFEEGGASLGSDSEGEMIEEPCVQIAISKESHFRPIFDERTSQGQGRLEADETGVGASDEVFDVVSSKQVAALRSAYQANQRLSQRGSEHGSSIDHSRLNKDLSWSNEFEIENMEYISAGKPVGGRKLVPLPRHLTSSVASDKDRVPSEADSLEGMIDDMARPVIYVETTKRPELQSSVSVPESLTPVSPLDMHHDFFVPRSGNYKLTYDMSDDNLDSTDDMLEEADSDVEHSSGEEETKDGKKRIERMRFKTQSSLDSLLDEEGVDTDIEKEFEDALRVAEFKSREASDDDDAFKTADKANTTKDVNQTVKPVVKGTVPNERGQHEVTSTSNIATETESTKEEYIPPKTPLSAKSSLDILIDKQGEFARAEPLRAKPPLTTMTSLDVLLYEQGDNIEETEVSVELDQEFKSVLENKFTKTMQSSSSDPDMTKEENVPPKIPLTAKSSLDILIDKQGEFARAEPLRAKPPLTTMTSLDVLLYEQGDNIEETEVSVELDQELKSALANKFTKTMQSSSSDPDMTRVQYFDIHEENIDNSYTADNAELNQALISALENKFTECIPGAASDPEIKPVTYLGVQVESSHDTPVLYQYHTSPESSMTQEEFDDVFGIRSGTLKSHEETTETKHLSKTTASMSVPIGYVAMKDSEDSSESDMLSVIEEEEDEVDEEPVDISGSDLHTAGSCNKLQEPDVCRSEPEMSAGQQGNQPEISADQPGNQSIAESENDADLSATVSGQISDKLYKKVQVMVQQGNTQTPTSSMKKAIDRKKGTKSHEKYQRLKERWMAIERHEADMLDLEDDDDDDDDDDDKDKEGEETSAIEPDQEQDIIYKEESHSKCTEVPVLIRASTSSEDDCIVEDTIEKEAKAQVVPNTDDLWSRLHQGADITNLKAKEGKHTDQTEEHHEIEVDVDEMGKQSAGDLEANIQTGPSSDLNKEAATDYVRSSSEETVKDGDERKTYKSEIVLNVPKRKSQSEEDTVEIGSEYRRTFVLGNQEPEMQTLYVPKTQHIDMTEIGSDTSIDSSRFCRTISEIESEISIADSNPFCRSISEVESEISVTDSNPLCQSISEMEPELPSKDNKKVIVDHTKVELRKKRESFKSRNPGDQSTTSFDIHSSAVCNSIDVGEPDDIPVFYQVQDDEETCQSIDENSAVIEAIIKSVQDKKVVKLFPANLSIDQQFNDTDDATSEKTPTQDSGQNLIPLTRVTHLKGAPPKPSELPKSSPLFQSDLPNEPPPTQPPSSLDPVENFKAPVPPPRRKRTVSSVSSSSDQSSSFSSETVDWFKTEKMAPTPRDSPRTISECSGSQDDSGHVSGGSTGNTPEHVPHHVTPEPIRHTPEHLRAYTPEHRRTESSYSQSSLPSTLSTVTDRSEEEEDIDKVVALHTQYSGSRGNLLAVTADSRESIASYYSDAGDFSYSNVPVTGDILFGLNYNYKTGMLEVAVKQCRDIAVVDTRRNRTDPYVKCYLLPDKTRSGKRKTKVKKHALNPTFDETLKYSISKSELENRTLWVTVWHNDRFGRNVFLGEVTINFDYYKFTDPTPNWYRLQERMDTQTSSIMVYKGDLSVRLRYVPPDKLQSSSNKGKQRMGKGRLEVIVKEARNLTAVRSNGFSDPFCKGYLLPERHKSSKQKTSVIRKNCNPVWNHTFVFDDVNPIELRERCLELTIWDHEKLASNDFLGGLRLNLGTGASAGKPVDWMDARGEEMTMWQAMLDRPNLWIDGALILRPNMEKRKF